MVKRVLLILFAVSVFSVLPVRASDPLPLDYIPANFAGFIQLQLTPEALTGLQLATVSAGVLQRINPDNFQSLDNYIPLTLLDVEDASYQQDIVPWLNGEIIVAYRQFEPGLRVTHEDVLLILPTNAPFQAATSLKRIIDAQEKPQKDTYRDIPLYIGDKSTIAITPTVVFIGATELVKAGLDRWAGSSASLTAQPMYTIIRAANPPDSFAFAYFNGENLTAALSVLLNGDPSAEPLLTAFGAALAQFHDSKNFEANLLTNAMDGVGVSLRGSRDPNNVKVVATVTFHSVNGGFSGDAHEFNPAVLNFAPRTAMVVNSGSNVRSAAYDLLAALPLTNFAGLILGGFPVQPSVGAFSGAVERPTGEQMRTAVSSFLNVLDTVAGFKLEDNLLAHLAGSYSVALLPRPNNPSPVLNTPFDLVIVAQTNDNQPALAGTIKLFKTLSQVPTLQEETVRGTIFRTLRAQPSGAVVVRFGIVDDMLIIATGDALEPALDAHDGDNRLVNSPRWKIVSGDQPPQLYVNLLAFFNTFLQSPGGQLANQGQTLLLTANSQYLQTGLFQMQIEIRQQVSG